jgi:hypothetical protein
MSVTIIEVLQNANMNFDNMQQLPQLRPLVKEQLSNAITLLEKGYDIYDNFDDIVNKHGSVDTAPDINHH